MKDWWESLESRERLSLIVLGAFLGVVFAYLLVLDPLLNGTSKMRKRVATAEADLAFMRAALPELTKAGAVGRSPSTRSPEVVVDSALRKYQLKSKRSQRLDDTSIRVQLDDASFNDLVLWLAELQRTEGMEVDAATIKRADAPGLADVSVTLARGTPGT